MFVEARARNADRVALSVVPMRAGVLEKQPGTLSSLLAELVSEVAGNVLPHAVDGEFVAMRRQQELDRRFVPGIASSIQYGVGLAFLIGLMAFPVARRWWLRLWPAEVRGAYANRGGFETARAVRWAVFALLFLPIAGIPAALWGLIRAAALFGERHRLPALGGRERRQSFSPVQQEECAGWSYAASTPWAAAVNEPCGPGGFAPISTGTATVLDLGKSARQNGSN